MKKIAVICAVLLLSGCAGEAAFREGRQLVSEGNADAGLAKLEEAMRAAPGNAEFRGAYIRARDGEARRRIEKAEAARAAGRFDEAAAAFAAALKLDPESPRAKEGFTLLEAERKRFALIEEARTRLSKGERQEAEALLRELVRADPRNETARQMLRGIEDSDRTRRDPSPQLREGLRKAVTLEFRDAPLKSVFDALSRQAGLNFIFDKDVKADIRTNLSARNTPVSDALDMLLLTNGLAKKVVNANTILLYPNTPAKQKDYEELVIRSFYLANADPKQTLAMVKTLVKTRDVFIDEKLNLLIMRDTPESVALAEKLVRLHDLAEPEVMLEVEVLEVKRSRLVELGLQWPNQFTVLNVQTTTTTVLDAFGNPHDTTVTTPSPLPLTVNSLKNLSGDRIAINASPALNVRGEDSDVNLLANPRIRVKNRDKAKIHIGDKVPVITSNVTATGVVSESVSYLDVGLKLDVEPQVMLEDDVAIKVGLEVSNIVKEIRGSTGTLTYQVGTRAANTTLRLRHGETQVLAGLINDEDRSSASKIPILGDIPLLGRLFGSKRDDAAKTEIMLLITPRIVRNVPVPPAAAREFASGTDSGTLIAPMLMPAMMPPPLLPLPLPPAPAPAQ